MVERNKSNSENENIGKTLNFEDSADQESVEVIPDEPPQAEGESCTIVNIFMEKSYRRRPLRHSSSII